MTSAPGTTIVLEPPCDFINANDRLHHHAKAKLTKAWRELTAAKVPTLRPRYIAAQHGSLPALVGFKPNHYERAHVVVSIRWPDARRRDPGNWYPTAKAIVDGLVDAGVIPDDDDRHVIGPDMRREYPNGPARVTVRIEELDA